LIKIGKGCAITVMAVTDSKGYETKQNKTNWLTNWNFQNQLVFRYLTNHQPTGHQLVNQRQPIGQPTGQPIG